MTGTETPLRKTEEHRSFLFLAIIWLLFVVLGRGSCINHHVCKNAFVEFVSISESHIAGIVVHASQSDLENIKQAISSTGSEIHVTSPKGTLIVTLEARRSVDIVDQLNAIHALPGGYSDSLVYRHHEDIEVLDQEIRDEPDASKLY